MKRLRYETKNEEEVPVAIDSSWRFQHSFSVSKEMLEGMEVGDEVVIEIRGKVTSLASSENGNDHTHTLGVQATEIACETHEESDPEEDMARGFKKVRSY